MKWRALWSAQEADCSRWQQAKVCLRHQSDEQQASNVRIGSRGRERAGCERVEIVNPRDCNAGGSNTSNVESIASGL